MSASLVFENARLHGGAAAKEALTKNADAIMDFAFAAQGREYHREAAPSVAPALNI